MSLQDAAWALKRVAELRAEMKTLSPEVRIEMLCVLMEGYCRECGTEFHEGYCYCLFCKDIDLD